MLGAGESGKSTFIRHMKLIHGDGYNDFERSSFIPIIHQNIINILTIIMDEIKISPDNNPVAEPTQLRNLSLDRRGTLADDSLRLVKELCSDERVKRFLETATRYELPDSASYFMDQVDRLLEEDYLPSGEDILRMRQASTGISEIYLPFGQARGKSSSFFLYFHQLCQCLG